jgi:hypothetical protein
MEVGLAIAALPALVGAVVIERWRRHTVREWRRAEVRASRRREAWDAVSELDQPRIRDRAA